MDSKKTPLSGWDKETFLKEVDYDIDLAQELIEIFFSSTKKLIFQMEKAFEEKNFLSLKQQAHSLKGASATIFFKEMEKLAFKLEKETKEEKISLLIEKIKFLRKTFQQKALKLLST